ncbi:protein serine/threonine kinase-1 [Plasmodium gaboni]|uniref:Protein serine/threonine kinase-1 n=1 Tax=Plasmodium gaboni TaxID=647221 RepID=A0ABY1UUG3_9APIC|nr:protein serine/threonine kinase-1 [Plasmodium gaboni]
MTELNIIDNNEKHSKYKLYKYCRNYINDFKNKYMMGYSTNLYKNSPNKYYYDIRNNNNNSGYYYNNYNNGYQLRNKRNRSFETVSNSKNKHKFSKKYKYNNEPHESFRDYDYKNKSSYSSVKKIYDREQKRYNKMFVESRYNEDHKNKYINNYNLSRKRNYYSYKKRIYTDRRNFDTHFGQGNIIYNNEYYLINDGSSLNKKRLHYAKCSFRSRSRSKNYNTYNLEKSKKMKYSSRHNIYRYHNGNKNKSISRWENNNTSKDLYQPSGSLHKYKKRSNFTRDDNSIKSKMNYENKKTDQLYSYEGKYYNKYDDKYDYGDEEYKQEYYERKKISFNNNNNHSSINYDDVEREVKKRKKKKYSNESKVYDSLKTNETNHHINNNCYLNDINKKNSNISNNHVPLRNRKRDKEYISDSNKSGFSNKSSYYKQKKKLHVDNYDKDSNNRSISRTSSDNYSRKKYTHKRNRTNTTDTEDKKERKKKKKKKENNESDDEIVHFSWKKGMLLNNCFLVIRKMGDGTFGRVLLCQHIDNKKYYAVKVVRNIKKYTRSAKIEADILKKIQNDDIKNNNIVKYHGKFMYYDHMCLIFEPLGPSLYEIITKNNYNGFHIEDIKLYCIEILKALNYLRKMSLTHTDLKPENILLDDPYFEKSLITVRRVTDGKKIQIYRTKSTGIKLIDFGCATFKSDYHGSIINTRQYRAPEVILNLGWDVSSDMWSFGCVLAELYTGSLLFRTHEHMEHLAMMESIIQPIPKKMLYEATKTNGSKYVNKDELKLAWPENASSVNSIKHVKKCLPLYKIIKHELFCDFLYSILQIDPTLRPSPAELLNHKFLQENYEYY